MSGHLSCLKNNYTWKACHVGEADNIYVLLCKHNSITDQLLMENS